MMPWRVVLLGLLLLAGCSGPFIQVGSPNLPAVQIEPGTTNIQVGSPAGPLVDVAPVVNFQGKLLAPVGQKGE